MTKTFEATSPLGRLLVEHRERVLEIVREHHAAKVPSPTKQLVHVRGSKKKPYGGGTRKGGTAA